MLTDKQIEDRKTGIGSSDAAIILGLSTYKTPYELYLEKVGLSTKKQEMTTRQEWGHILEPIIRIQYAKRNNIKIHGPKEHANYSPLCDLITYDLDAVTHPNYKFMRANLDGFIPELNSIHEIKCSDAYMAYEWGEDGSDVVPMTYLVQVAHASIIKDTDAAIISTLIGGNDPRDFKYTRDLALEVKLIEAETEFWKCVEDKQPPAPINEDDLRLMYPKQKEEKKIIINDKLVPIITDLNSTKRKIKELEELSNQYRFEIMEYMKDSEALTDSNGIPLVTWKATKKGNRTFLLKGI